MAEPEKKEGIFKKAVDAFSSKDEKETIAELEAELEQAKKDSEAAKTAINDLMKQNTEAKKDSSSADMKAKAAEKRIAELEAKLKDLTVKEKQVGASKASVLEGKLAKPAIITVHTVESNNQTLSHVALKYYKHATPPYWQFIIEVNKDTIGSEVKDYTPGKVIKIAELPEDFLKK